MIKSNMKILVASHKPDQVYSDEVYTPIHVGRSISSYKEIPAWRNALYGYPYFNAR